MVDISAEYHDQMVNRIAEHSRFRSILMNGVTVYDRETRVRRKVVRILCEKSDAETLLLIAETVCQEAVSEIKKGIIRSRQP